MTGDFPEPPTDDDLKAMLVTAEDVAAMRPTWEEVERLAAGKPGQGQRIAAAIVAVRPLDWADLCTPARISRPWREFFRAEFGP